VTKGDAIETAYALARTLPVPAEAQGIGLLSWFLLHTLMGAC
jgi:hypothetical protein